MDTLVSVEVFNTETTWRLGLGQLSLSRAYFVFHNTGKIKAITIILYTIHVYTYKQHICMT